MAYTSEEHLAAKKGATVFLSVIAGVNNLLEGELHTGRVSGFVGPIRVFGYKPRCVTLKGSGIISGHKTRSCFSKNMK